MRGLICSVIFLVGCGGKAVVDAGAGGHGGAGAATGGTENGCEGQPCGTPCFVVDSPTPSGECNVDGMCAYEAVCMNAPCITLDTCDECTVCNDMECLNGFCHPDLTCQPEDPCR